MHHLFRVWLRTPGRSLCTPRYHLVIRDHKIIRNHKPLNRGTRGSRIRQPTKCGSVNQGNPKCIGVGGQRGLREGEVQLLRDLLCPGLLLLGQLLLQDGVEQCCNLALKLQFGRILQELHRTPNPADSPWERLGPTASVSDFHNMCADAKTASPRAEVHSCNKASPRAVAKNRGNSQPMSPFSCRNCLAFPALPLLFGRVAVAHVFRRGWEGVGVQVGWNLGVSTRVALSQANGTWQRNFNKVPWYKSLLYSGRQ